MWNFFLREQSSEYPYLIIEKDCLYHSPYYQIFKGSSKNNLEAVTIITHNKSTNNSLGLEVTRNYLRRAKTLRHPCILTYLDTYEDHNCLNVVTESMESLFSCSNLIKERDMDLYVPLGIRNVVRAVSFLNNDAKLRHNNICGSSIFITGNGDWKIGELGFISNLNDVYPKKLSNYNEYDPPEISLERKVSSHYAWAIDTWGLGIFIWEVFNGRCQQKSDLKNMSNIPIPIKAIYAEMIGTTPDKRPNAAEILERLSQRNGYFDNVLINAIDFIEELHFQNKKDINDFFENFLQIFDEIPAKMLKFKVLPRIIQGYELFGFESAIMVSVAIKISELMDKKDFEEYCLQFIIKLFQSSDRAIRSILLKNYHLLEEKISSTTINNTIFPCVVNGFIDATPQIREDTVKAMVYIVPNLNYKIIDEEVLKHFAYLQSKDTHGGIRTNVTICLGKIAAYLNPEKRSAILISAFLRSLVDSFPPVRNAGVLGLAVCQQYFTLEETSKKVLPALCRLTIDNDLTVRENSFKTIKGFLAKLEAISKNPEVQAEMEKELSTTFNNRNSKYWTTWAISSLTSTFSTVGLNDIKFFQSNTLIKENTKSNEKELKDERIQEKNMEPFNSLSSNQIHSGSTNSLHSISTKSEESYQSVSKNVEEPVEESGWDFESWVPLSDDEVNIDRNIKSADLNPCDNYTLGSGNVTSTEKFSNPKIDNQNENIVQKNDSNKKISTSSKKSDEKAETSRRTCSGGPMKLGKRITHTKNF